MLLWNAVGVYGTMDTKYSIRNNLFSVMYRTYKGSVRFGIRKNTRTGNLRATAGRIVLSLKTKPNRVNLACYSSNQETR